jgi:hypothetical protein
VKVKIKPSKKSLVSLLEPRYLKLSYYLFNLVNEYDSLLDLGGGSGAAWGIHVPLNLKNRTVVDLYQPGLDKALESGNYTHAVYSDILAYLKAQESESFDVVLATSVIEHLSTEAGVELASEMKRVSKKLAIIFTPNGFVPQPPDADNKYQEHISGWSSDQLELLGYEFDRGFNGLKYLRTTYGAVRLKPNFIGIPLVLISAFLTRKSKRFAFEILHVATK